MRTGRRGPAPDFSETLRALYRRYCEVESRELLALLPKEGLRSVWRHRARSGEAGSSGDDGRVSTSPPSLDQLREAAAKLLPLPPYEVWVQSYLAHRAPYLERLGIPTAPSRPDPVTISTRCIEDGLWAHLDLLHRDGLWVGFVTFHGSALPAGLRTANIFRGEDPTEIQDRFHSFTPATLRAFLRSVSD